MMDGGSIAVKKRFTAIYGLLLLMRIDIRS